MRSRSEDEEMVPESDEDHAPPGQGQDQDQEEGMGSRGQDEQTVPEKDEDPPSDSPQGQAQDQDVHERVLKINAKRAPSRRHPAKPHPAVGHAREADPERKTSSSTCLREKLSQFMEPLLLMLVVFFDDLTRKGPCTILTELVKVFIRCLLRINYIAPFNKKSQCQHEFATDFDFIIGHRLEKLSCKRDEKSAHSKHLANPASPSTSTAVDSDAESSIEIREAFHEGKNLSSSWLLRLTQVLATLHMKLCMFVDDLMHNSAGAILERFVKTFIYYISCACSLAQCFDTAERRFGLEAINYAREIQYEFAVKLGKLMLQQLRELYPFLPPMIQGNSVNRPPVENVRRNPWRSVRQSQLVLQGHDKERSKRGKYRGVWRKGNGKWAAEIRDKDCKKQWLGTHSTEEEAALAYDRGAIEHGRSNVKLNFPKLNFRKPSEEILEREFKIVKKARSKRHLAKPDLPSSSETRLAQPDLPSSSGRRPTPTAEPDLPSSGKRRPPLPNPVQLDLPSSSERCATKPRTTVIGAREADRGRKTLALSQKELNQLMAPLLKKIGMFVDDLMQNQPCAISELVKVFIDCIVHINYFAALSRMLNWKAALLAASYAKKCKHEFVRAFCSITKHELEKLGCKNDLKRACSKNPANPDLPSSSTAVVSEEESSDDSIGTKEAFRGGKNLSSSWLQQKLTEVLSPLRRRLRMFFDDLMQASAVAILSKLVKTFINCISRACSLGQQFDMAQRESSLEAINSTRKSRHEFAVELGLIMLQQLGEHYPSLQPKSQGNSVNRPPAAMHHSFIREHTNDVNMRDRPSTSTGVVANVEAASSHQNVTNAGKQDSGDQGNETAEVGHRGMRVESVTQELVALLEEQHDLEICAIEMLLSLSSTSQEGEGEE